MSQGETLKRERRLLHDNRRMMVWWDRACANPSISSMNGSEQSRLEFFTLIEHSLASRTARNAVALLISLVKNPSLRMFIRFQDEENARRRLKVFAGQRLLPRKVGRKAPAAYCPTW